MVQALLFMGVLSLATSGHLPPAPLNQTNTKPEMPEPDNTNYTLQLVYSLPGAWEAAPHRLLCSGALCVCVCVGHCFSFFPQIPLSLSLSSPVLYTIILFPLPVRSG